MYVTHTKHFSEHELACHCGCGDARMLDWFMEALEKIREEYARPMKVTSGYRCPNYNALVSKTGRTGPHTKRCAVDVKVYGEDAYRLLMVALRHGVTGIGVNQTGPHSSRFIHLDMLMDETKRPWVWTY